MNREDPVDRDELGDRSSPVQATDLGSVGGIGAGYIQSFAIKTDGAVFTWGYNTSGQLGNGTTTDGVDPLEWTPCHSVAAEWGEDGWLDVTPECPGSFLEPYPRMDTEKHWDPPAYP